MIKRKKMISLLLVLTLVSGMFVQTYATEIDDTKKTKIYIKVNKNT